MTLRLAALLLPCVALGVLLGATPGDVSAESQSTAPTPVQSSSADTSAQMTFENGDVYRGDVLVAPHSSVPDQPQDARVTFADKQARSGYVAPDGPGELTFGNGWTLNATFARGRANGPGTLAGPGGFRLDDGTFVDGSATSGSIAFGDGSTYRGGLRNGCFAGAGSYHAKNGADAMGTWVPVLSGDPATCSGSRLDPGTVRNAGTRFDGSLDVAGRPDGRGLFSDRHGRHLSGTWAHGAYAGTFTQTERNGWRDFLVDVAAPSSQLDGAGTYFNLDGSRIYGRFRNGALAGPAVLVDGAGVRHAGNVSDGRFEGRDRSYSVSLDPFHDFIGRRDSFGRPDGRGSLTYYDSEHEHPTSVVSGKWRHGTMTGVVRVMTPGKAAPVFFVRVAPPGDRLRGRARVVFPHKSFSQSGMFADGALNGPGSIVFANPPGCRLVGTFRAGIMHRATELCPGDPPYRVEIADDGSVR